MAGDRELYLLRNQSRGHGVGFLVDEEKYFPDFILWLKTPEAQHIVFVDPKGLLMEGSLTASPRVQLCETIKDYEETLNESTGREDFNLHAFIISQIPREKLKKQSELSTPEEFAGQGIYFASADNHIAEMLHRVLMEEREGVEG